jgi:2-oxoisovalerate dehydrogenase E1 component
MLLLRRFEERVDDAFRNRQIPGLLHLYIGQEAVAVGVCAHLAETDVITSTHRGHGHALAKGVPPRELMAELFGRATGCSGGRGGSMHLFSAAVGLYGTSGLVGPSIPTAAGAAYAFKYRQEDRVAVAFFGDGAVHAGSFHEGVNLAGLWELPVVFVCENNRYAADLPLDRTTRNGDLAARAAAYGVRGVSVDGMDVTAVHAAAGEALARARRGHGPTLIVAETYRYVGHYAGDPGTGYRTVEEVSDWKARDPIARLRTTLLANGLVTEVGLGAMGDAIDVTVQDAIDYATGSPWPDPEAGTDAVFAPTPGG